MRNKIQTFLFNILIYVHNFVMDIALWFLPVKKIIKANESLRNKYEGQSCIILGNGPSLRTFDQNLIGDKKTFACNYFYKNQIFPNLVPDYYVLIDELFYHEEFFATKEAMEKYPESTFLFKSKCMKNSYIAEKVKAAKNTIVTFSQKAFVDEKVYFDLTKNFTASINVVNYSIQVAMYMGFKRIYLVGCDFNSFASRKPQYFYSSTAQSKPISLGDELYFYSQVCYHHYALEKLSKKIGVEIVNVTQGSLLDAYGSGEILDDAQ